jgi:spermidine synthase
VVGLGAGLLPMFLHNHLPIDHIQVVELDGVIGDVAKRQFGFVENDRMQVSSPVCQSGESCYIY